MSYTPTLRINSSVRGNKYLKEYKEGEQAGTYLSLEDMTRRIARRRLELV